MGPTQTIPQPFYDPRAGNTVNRAERRAAAKDIAQQMAEAERQEAKGGRVLGKGSASPKTLFMGYAAGADVRTAWHRSILACAVRSQEFGYVIRPRDVESGPDLAKARNMLLKSFLDTEDQYLLFVDTDIAFAPQDVAMLLAADAPIAGALYFTAALGMEPWPVAMVERLEDASGEAEDGADKAPGPSRTDYVPITLPTPPDDLEAEGATEEWLATLSMPIPVAGVGMGLTLIKREVAQRVAANFEFPFEYADGRSEDLTFCLRAGELNYQTVVMPAARVGHLKVTML